MVQEHLPLVLFMVLKLLSASDEFGLLTLELACLSEPLLSHPGVGSRQIHVFLNVVLLVDILLPLNPVVILHNKQVILVHQVEINKIPLLLNEVGPLIVCKRDVHTYVAA